MARKPRTAAHGSSTRNAPAAGQPGASPRRARSDAEREAKERRILEAALDVFAEKGFAVARLDDVAAQAGVAKGTIYLYFPSKEALFEALIRTGVAAPIEAAAAEALAQDVPFEAVLRIFFSRMREQVLQTRRKEIIRLVIAEAGRFPAVAEFYYREVVSRGMTLLRLLSQRALERGEISFDDSVRFPQLIVAPGLIALFWTSLFERFEPLDWEAMFEAHLHLLMRGLRGTPQ